MRTALLPFALLLTTAAIGCAAPEADANDDASEAITGGAPAGPALATSVVRLLTHFSGGGVADDYIECTGALVGPRRVLTSAWCVGATASSTPRLEGRVATGTDPMALDMGHGTRYSSVKALGNGLAIAVLDADLPGGTPLTVGPAPADGARVTALSYGCVENKTRPSGELMKRSLAWNEWKGLFWGTTFLCHSNDDGTVLLDERARVVAVTASGYEADVVPVSGLAL